MCNTVQNLSFKFAVKIVRYCNDKSVQSIVSRPIIQQLLKSETSIGANIQEAQAAQSKKEFLSKMYIAFKEAKETNYWLRLFIESNISDEKKLQNLLCDSIDLVKLLYCITKSTRQNLNKIT